MDHEELSAPIKFGKQKMSKSAFLSTSASIKDISTLLSSSSLSNCLSNLLRRAFSETRPKRLVSHGLIPLALGLGVSTGAYATTETFDTPATSGSWTVPAGVFEVTLTTRGGAGGLGDRATREGGAGATVTGSLAVSPGDVIHYVVGEQGGSGGAGDGGGGGSTAFFLNNTLIIVAGGGAGYDNTARGQDQGGLATTDGGIALAGNFQGTRCPVQVAATGGAGGVGGLQDCPAANPSSGGGGGINSAGQVSTAGAGGGGAADLDPSDGLTVSPGGAASSTGLDGGSGFTGGGGSDPFEAGGGGGYSGGAGANSGGSAGAGGSFAAPIVNLANITAGAVSSNTGDGNATITYIAIITENNDFSASAIQSTGGTTPSVFTGDTVDGNTPTSSTVDVSLTDTDGLTGATINSDGTINIPAGTNPGNYTLTYQICEAGSTTNCDTATVEILVVGPSLSLTKTADSTGPHAPGDVVTYTYTATNDGNVNINDVTVSDVHNGSAPLGPLTLGTLTNTSGLSSDDGADAVFDVLAPGDVIDFTAEYVVTATDLIAGGPVTNTATATGTPSAGTLTPPTASESISLSGGTPRPSLAPGVCGSFVREGFIINPGSSRTEVNADFGSGAAGPAPFDPYVLEPLFGRDASTGVVSFYQTSADASATGSFLANGVALANSNNIANTTATVANPTSEIWRVAARLDGIPGTTETITIDNGTPHEHTAYWQTDINGAIINTNSSSNAGHDDGWIFGAATTTPGADGPTYTIDVTYPADGIVILQFALLDSTGGFGGINFDDYECPTPSLSMTKVADNPGPYTVGDVVTYTYTVVNDGDQIVKDVAISDTHNGSDPAPIPGNETLLTDAAPTGDSTDAGADNSWDVLAPGDTVVFTGTYTITATDVVALQ